MKIASRRRGRACRKVDRYRYFPLIRGFIAAVGSHHGWVPCIGESFVGTSLWLDLRGLGMEFKAAETPSLVKKDFSKRSFQVNSQLLSLAFHCR